MSRPPLLLLHGFTGVPADFDLLPGLVPAAGVIAPPLPGHAGVDEPEARQRSTMRTAVDLLLREISQTGAARVDVLGYSLGGRTALSLLAAAPDRIRRVVVVGASAGLVDTGLREVRAADDRRLARHIVRIGVDAFIAEWESMPLIRSQSAIDPAHRALMRAARSQHSAVGLAESLINMGLGTMPPLHNVLRRIDNPVLCVAGADDLRYRAAATEVAQLLSAGRILHVPDAGHAAHLEAPEAFLHGVLPFLNDESDERSS